MTVFINKYLCIALAAMPLLAYAQQKTRSTAADAAAAVPATSYDSAFDGYIPDREAKPVGWKEVNDEVGQLGGHVGQLRGATGGAGRSAVPASKPSSKPSAPPDKPAAGGHAGHPK